MKELQIFADHITLLCFASQGQMYASLSIIQLQTASLGSSMQGSKAPASGILTDPKMCLTSKVN